MPSSVTMRVPDRIREDLSLPIFYLFHKTFLSFTRPSFSDHNYDCSLGVSG